MPPFRFSQAPPDAARRRPVPNSTPRSPANHPSWKVSDTRRLAASSAHCLSVGSPTPSVPPTVEEQRFVKQQKELAFHRNKLYLEGWVEERRAEASTTDREKLFRMQLLFLNALRYHEEKDSVALVEKLSISFDRRQEQRRSQGLSVAEDRNTYVGTTRKVVRTVLQDLKSLQSTHGTPIAMQALISMNLWDVSAA